MNNDNGTKPSDAIKTEDLISQTPHPLVSPTSAAAHDSKQENAVSTEQEASVSLEDVITLATTTPHESDASTMRLTDSDLVNLSAPQPSESSLSVAEPDAQVSAIAADQEGSVSPKDAAPADTATTPRHDASATQPAGSAVVHPSAKPGQTPSTEAQVGKPLATKIHFQIPNAKIGVQYAGKIEGLDQKGAAVRVRTPLLPTGLGLVFDETTGELRGKPLIDGEQRIPLLWSSDGMDWKSGECLFFINPDPRSLWKVIEPPSDEPYHKEHTDSATVKASPLSIYAASRRGRSHEHSGTFRDDDFLVSHDPAANWSVMIVADGAGSAKSSRQGSKLAVEAFGSHLTCQLAGDLGRKLSEDLTGWDTDSQAAVQSMGTDFHYLFHKAGTLAVQAIEAEAQDKGVPVKEYSTTLLAAVVRRNGDSLFLSTFWMGDGAIAAYGPRGKVRLMGTPDGGEYAGQTRFLDRAALADAGFAKRIGIGRYSDISALMLMTDGVSDPRFETDAGLADPALWDNLWDELLPLIKSENPAQALVEWLHFFTPGHHDDRTIAILV